MSSLRYSHCIISSVVELSTPVVVLICADAVALLTVLYAEPLASIYTKSFAVRFSHAVAVVAIVGENVVLRSPLEFNLGIFPASPAHALVCTKIVVSVTSISKSNCSFPPGFIVVLLSQSHAVSLLSSTAGVVSFIVTATFVSAPQPEASVDNETSGFASSLNFIIPPSFLNLQLLPVNAKSNADVEFVPSLPSLLFIAVAMSSQN